jgi:oligopeptide/dipeptide ABC transporter ATP-binding protein
MAAAPLLSVSNLTTSFRTEGGTVRAIEDVSFSVAPGEVLGVVGESGSGKSVTALSIMRLMPRGGGHRLTGNITFDGLDLLALSRDRLNHIRGKQIAMIFQEPMTSLNPVFSVGDQLIEPLMRHERLPRRAARERAVELMARVGIASPRDRLASFPHQLSGGMRQRVMIAMAISCRPRLLIADEPTTALDATVQAQILDLLRELRAEFDLALMLITHDLGVIAEMADRVMVMYAGRVVEIGSAERVLRHPGHPYARGLLEAIPDPEAPPARRLRTIPGTIPSPLALPPGCRFAPRCGFREERCIVSEPPLSGRTQDGHRVACIHPGLPAPAESRQ